jgi:predicted transcriptional regulator of viral defense system
MAQDSARKVLALARKLGILRPSDLHAAGLRREYVQRLLARGQLERIGRGLYAVPAAKVSAHRSLAEVSKVVPQGVVCLLSALRYHGLTTQHPSEVWIALPNKAWRPKRTPFPVRLVYFSDAARRSGIETQTIDGVAVRIYAPAKTVADCFKFRNKIGIDVAIEALRDYLKKHRGGVDALWRYAKICRVQRVMQPYLEAAS